MNLEQVAKFVSEVNEIALKEIKENKDKIKLEDTISEEDKKSGKYISLEKMVKTSEKLANTTIKIDKAEREEAKPEKAAKTKSVHNMNNLTYEQKVEMFLADKDFFRAVKDLLGITIMKKFMPEAIKLLEKGDEKAYKKALREIVKFEKAANNFFEKVGIIEKRSQAQLDHIEKNRTSEFDQMVRQMQKDRAMTG